MRIQTLISNRCRFPFNSDLFSAVTLTTFSTLIHVLTQGRRVI